MTLWLLLACVRAPAPAPPDPHTAPYPPALQAPKPGALYLGSPTCAACHPQEAAQWQSSAHAHALDTLMARQKGYDPACLACHTTGFGRPGGFARHADDGHLAGLGCEACHGPGSLHVAAPAPGFGALKADGSSCTGCHTAENSPDFSWKEYWPQIAHGG